MGSRLETSKFVETTADEELETIERQKRRNIQLGLFLLGLVILIIAAMIYMISMKGFQPLNEMDIFGSQ